MNDRLNAMQNKVAKGDYSYLGDTGLSLINELLTMVDEKDKRIEELEGMLLNPLGSIEPIRRENAELKAQLDAVRNVIEEPRKLGLQGCIDKLNKIEATLKEEDDDPDAVMNGSHGLKNFAVLNGEDDERSK